MVEFFVNGVPVADFNAFYHTLNHDNEGVRVTDPETGEEWEGVIVGDPPGSHIFEHSPVAVGDCCWCTVHNREEEVTLLIAGARNDGVDVDYYSGVVMTRVQPPRTDYNPRTHPKMGDIRLAREFTKLYGAA